MTTRDWLLLIGCLAVARIVSRLETWGNQRQAARKFRKQVQKERRRRRHMEHINGTIDMMERAEREAEAARAGHL